MEMIPQFDSKLQPSQILILRSFVERCKHIASYDIFSKRLNPTFDFHKDEAAANVSYRRSVRKSYDPQCTDDRYRNTEPSFLCPEAEKLIKDSSMDYAEKIKELHLYIDMVKKLAKPGCSSEILNVALSSMASLVETLSAVSSVQYMQSSL